MPKAKVIKPTAPAEQVAEDTVISEGCTTASHAAQRARIGAGFLLCNKCFEEIPNEVQEPQAVKGSTCKGAYHAAQRARIGAGYLVCDVCGFEIAN